jgi:putative membrane protein
VPAAHGRQATIASDSAFVVVGCGWHSYDRTVAAEPDLRILQANERTLLAWIRTGLAAMAFGFVVARLAMWLHVEHPERETPLASWLGIAIVALGTACHLVGATRFCRARRAIIDGRDIAPSAVGPVTLAVFVAVMGLATVAYLATTD